MEFMLLPDNNIQTFPKIATEREVKELLQLHGGIAYYWCTTEFGWRIITSDSHEYSTNRVSEEDVPEIIKLAQMLE